MDLDLDLDDLEESHHSDDQAYVATEADDDDDDDDDDGRAAPDDGDSCDKVCADMGHTPAFALFAMTQLTVLMYAIFAHGLVDLHANPFLGPATLVLRSSGARFGASELRAVGAWWRLISANAVDAGFLHVLGCIALQFFFVRDIERHWGSARAVLVMLLGGSAGHTASSLFGPPVMASGGAGAAAALAGADIAFVCALWGASAFWASGRAAARRRAARVRRVVLALFLVVVELGVLSAAEFARADAPRFYDAVSTHVDTYAHAGGFVAGLLLGLVLAPPTVPHSVAASAAHGAAGNFSPRALALQVLLMTSAGGAWLVSRSAAATAAVPFALLALVSLASFIPFPAPGAAVVPQMDAGVAVVAAAASAGGTA
eukprot:g2697.t1